MRQKISKTDDFRSASAQHEPFQRCIRIVGMIEINGLFDPKNPLSPGRGKNVLYHLLIVASRFLTKLDGFGFIEMTSADAARAMQALDGKDYEGRALKVNEAQARERSGAGGGGQRRY